LVKDEIHQIDTCPDDDGSRMAENRSSENAIRMCDFIF
jgi:hypothetical protein